MCNNKVTDTQVVVIVTAVFSSVVTKVSGAGGLTRFTLSVCLSVVH